jgi:hypothetical protein
LRASLAVKPNLDLPFDRATLESGAISIASDDDHAIDVARAIAAARLSESETAAYDLYFKVEEIVLPEDLRRRIDPSDRLGNMISAALVDAAIALDRPIDRHSFDAGRDLPAIRRIEVNSARIAWDDIVVDISGALEVDRLGVLDGTLNIQARQWRKVIEMLAAVGIIEERMIATLTDVAATMAEGGEVLDLPLQIQGGFMSMGLLPLGPAPRLR